AVAGRDEPVALGVVAPAPGGQDEPEPLLGGEHAVLSGDGVGGHFLPFAFRPPRTACRASRRWSMTSTLMARSSVSARVAVRRAFSAAGSGVPSSTRSRVARS